MAKVDVNGNLIEEKVDTIVITDGWELYTMNGEVFLCLDGDDYHIPDRDTLENFEKALSLASSGYRWLSKPEVVLVD